MKKYVDLKRANKEFNCGDFVYLKIQPYKQLSLANSAFHELAARYYGPFKVLERVGKVAYKLELPAGTRIHDVFHGSLLKAHHCPHIASQELPLYSEEGEFVPQPLVVLDRRMKKKGNKDVTEVLIQWQHTNPEDAVRKELHSMQHQFPDFDWRANRP